MATVKDSPQPTPLFIYGTLCANALLAWALTGEASNVDTIKPLLCPARAYGFARYGVHGCDYPAAIIESKSYIDGYIITCQNKSQRKKLDDFEGEAYKAVSTKVYVLNDNNDNKPGMETVADIYLWNGSMKELTQEPWDLQAFIDTRLEDWLDLFEGMELTGDDEDPAVEEVA